MYLELEEKEVVWLLQCINSRDVGFHVTCYVNSTEVDKGSQRRKHGADVQKDDKKQIILSRFL
jgi:hypothetical protein